MAFHVCICPASLRNLPIFNVVNKRHKFRNTTQLQTGLSLIFAQAHPLP
jgi:hypothetical protein